MAALRAGKHVLCEKPLAVSTAEILEMRDALRKTDRILMTAQHHRYSEASVAIKAWIDTGALGEVYHTRVNATRRNWLPTSPGFIDPEAQRRRPLHGHRGTRAGHRALADEFPQAGARQRPGPHQFRQGL